MTEGSLDNLPLSAYYSTMSEADEAAHEAGVASFPIDSGHCARSCAACADVSEAWAWRVADASALAHLPEGWDSTQSQRDARADAETLTRYVLDERPGEAEAQAIADSHWWSQRAMSHALASGPREAATRTRAATTRAFRAVPGLRS